MFNALTFDKDILKRAGSKNCSHIYYVGKTPIKADKVTDFLLVDEEFDGKFNGNVYLSSLLLDDRIIDDVIDYVLSEKCKIIINACSTLNEVGECDKRFGATPIGLAHKFGLLDGAYVSGCTYLDKDDIDLINQSGAKVILTPSATLGEGMGIPPLRMLISLGAIVHLGSGLAEYNKEGDMIFERNLISLAVSGAHCTRHAVSDADLDKMLRYSDR